MKIIDEDIKSGQFKNSYLFYGEETYLKRQYKDKLVKALTNEGDTMNFSVYEGKDINPKEIIDLAETMPFLAERRVILIEDSGFFKNSCEELAEYVKEVSPSTVLLFVENEVDKRNKLYKQVQKNGQVVCFERQNDDTLMRWVGQRLKEDGKTMKREAYQLFITKVGNDMENIDKELEKLICYCMDKENIESEDVEAICIEQTTNKIFEMVNAVSEKNQRKAMELYDDLLILKEPPMRILFLLARQFQKLLLVKELTKAGYDSRTIAGKAGMPEFAVRKNQAMARSFSTQQLKGAVEDSVELEEAVKTGRMNDRMAVELLLMKYSTKEA